MCGAVRGGEGEASKEATAVVTAKSGRSETDKACKSLHEDSLCSPKTQGKCVIKSTVLMLMLMPMLMLMLVLMLVVVLKFCYGPEAIQPGLDAAPKVAACVQRLLDLPAGS